jgi:predicted glutamine amidotransferase
MCGIVGIARFGTADLSAKECEVFLQMLNTGIVRGHHGTGIFAVQASGKARMVKQAGPPYMLMVSKEFQDFWKTTNKDTMVLVGHNRFATTGQKITKHAHPFIKNHIALVHNGSLEKDLKLPKFKSFDVDSEALAHAIATEGLKNAISETVGAYALVFWDSKEGTLNLLRNVERPLSIAIDTMFNRIIMASERKMLEWIMSRNYMEHKDVPIIDLPPNELWTFAAGSATPVKTPVLGKTRVYPTAYAGYQGDWWKDQVWDQVAGRYVTKDHVTTFEADEDQLNAIEDFFQGAGLPDNSTTVPTSHVPAVILPPTRTTTGPYGASSEATPKASTTPTQPPKRDSRIKEVFPNTKQYSQTIIHQVEGAKGKQFLRKGERIEVWVDDHVVENSSKQQYVIIAIHESWPNVRFQFRVEKDGVLDAMFECVVVSVEIQNILIPGKQCPADAEVIVWANNPRIIPSLLTS